MRYIYAIAACFALFILYALIGGILEWKHGGGVIPMLIFFAALVGTWRAVTKKNDAKQSTNSAASKNNENPSISSELFDENRETKMENKKLKIESISPDSPLLFLAIFQQEGRLIDFLKEDISTYSDAEIGAAARIVHTGCKKAISKYVSIEPISTEIEGTKITLPTNFDPKLFCVNGGVASSLPSTGTLMHRGWLVSSVNLPQMNNQHKSRYLLAPMEVDL